MTDSGNSKLFRWCLSSRCCCQPSRGNSGHLGCHLAARFVLPSRSSGLSLTLFSLHLPLTNTSHPTRTIIPKSQFVFVRSLRSHTGYTTSISFHSDENLGRILGCLRSRARGIINGFSHTTVSARLFCRLGMISAVHALCRRALCNPSSGPTAFLKVGLLRSRPLVHQRFSVLLLRNSQHTAPPPTTVLSSPSLCADPEPI